MSKKLATSSELLRRISQHVILCNVMIVLLPSPSQTLTLWLWLVQCNGSHVVYVLWFLNLNCVLSSFRSITAELRSKLCPLCSSPHIPLSLFHMHGVGSWMPILVTYIASLHSKSRMKKMQHYTYCCMVLCNLLKEKHLWNCWFVLLHRIHYSKVNLCINLHW